MPSKVCEIQEDDLECSICTEVYFIPMRTQCKHTFCGICLFLTTVSHLDVSKPDDELYCLCNTKRIFCEYRSTVTNVISVEEIDPIACPLCRSKITKSHINFRLQRKIEQMFKQRPQEEWAARKAEERRKLKQCFLHANNFVNNAYPGLQSQEMIKMEWQFYITSAALTARGIREHGPALMEGRVENLPEKVFGVQNWEDIEMFDKIV